MSINITTEKGGNMTMTTISIKPEWKEVSWKEAEAAMEAGEEARYRLAPGSVGTRYRIRNGILISVFDNAVATITHNNCLQGPWFIRRKFKKILKKVEIVEAAQHLLNGGAGRPRNWPYLIQIQDGQFVHNTTGGDGNFALKLSEIFLGKWLIEVEEEEE